MGIYLAPDECFIFDTKTFNIESSFDGIEYFIIWPKRYSFKFLHNFKISSFVKDNKHILKGLLYNEKFQLPKEIRFIDNQVLENIINEAQIPLTPKEKLDGLILFLHEKQDFEGAPINYEFQNNYFIHKLYLKNYDEFWFYLKTLKEMELVDFKEAIFKGGKEPVSLTLTYKGLEYIIGLHESGEKSKNCFIAMSFSQSASDIRNSVKKVVIETGFKPLLIDEIHYDSDQTINDAIINYIRRSKFIISDFTEQKHGVYFEAGFALGLNKQVIYTCSKKDFSNTHFDTNHYPHIVYDDLKELEQKLKNKILAWII